MAHESPYVVAHERSYVVAHERPYVVAHAPVSLFTIKEILKSRDGSRWRPAGPSRSSRLTSGTQPPGTLLNRRLSGFKIRSGLFSEEKYSCAYRSFSPQSSSYSDWATPAPGLFLLPTMSVMSHMLTARQSSFPDSKRLRFIMFLYLFLFSKTYSSVGIATRYGLDGPGIESRRKSNFLHPSIPVLVLTPTSCTTATVSFPVLKWPGPSLDHPPSSAEVKERV